MKIKLILAAILLCSATVARANTFIAEFNCPDLSACGEIPKDVHLHFNQTDGRFEGAAHWDQLLWDFFLPDNWATGRFSWGAFKDQTSLGTDFLTFRIQDLSPVNRTNYFVQIDRLCTEETCSGQNLSSFGDVVFHPQAEKVSEASTVLLLILGSAFVVAFKAK